MNTRVTTRTLATLALAMGLPMALAGCDNPNIPESNNAADVDDADDHAGHDHAESTPHYYTGIRGIVEEMPSDTNPDSMLEIRHEHIPDFKTAEGEINVNAQGIPGMRSMKMPFPVGEDASLEGIEVGDKVEFDFTVNWGGDTGPAWKVTRIERLDASTVIDFENAVVEDFAGQAQDTMDQAQDAMDDMDHMDHMDHDGP